MGQGRGEPRKDVWDRLRRAPSSRGHLGECVVDDGSGESHLIGEELVGGERLYPERRQEVLREVSEVVGDDDRRFGVDREGEGIRHDQGQVLAGDAVPKPEPESGDQDGEVGERDAAR